jgi:hypothetical protein
MPRPRWSRAFATVLLLGTAAASVAAAQSPILGTWRGTSTCADKVAFPACNDEVVIYVVKATEGRSDSVTVRADKIVGGDREFMGEFQFGSSSPGTWQSEFQTARYHGRWTLTIEGTQMTGTLVDLPSGRLVRRVSLQRAPA